MSEHQIPPITDPLGRHWQQPPRERVLVDDTHAIMSRDDFNLVPVYQASLPSGTYAGKMWRKEFRGEWWLGWYGEVVNAGTQIAVYWRRLLVVE